MRDEVVVEESIKKQRVCYFDGAFIPCLDGLVEKYNIPPVVKKEKYNEFDRFREDYKKLISGK
jgi:hypothetical protein